MNPRTPIILAVVLLLAACGDSGTGPGPEPANPGGFFHEPASACLIRDRTADSLTVTNYGPERLVWTLEHAPAGATGLVGRLDLEPLTARILDWEWDPPGPYPVVDSIVAATNDPRRPRMVVPVRREDPDANFFPVHPLVPPVPGYPADGFVVTYPDTVVDLRWSRLATCTLRTIYEVQLSEDPVDFPAPGQPTLFQEPFTQLIFARNGADRGVTVYWRVRVRDGETRPWSPWSKVRSVVHR